MREQSGDFKYGVTLTLLSLTSPAAGPAHDGTGWGGLGVGRVGERVSGERKFENCFKGKYRASFQKVKVATALQLKVYK